MEDGEEQSHSNDEGISDEEDNQMPRDMNLYEASLRGQKVVLVIKLEEGNGIETTNADKESNDEVSTNVDISKNLDMEKYFDHVGEPVIEITDDENHELNESVEHLEHEDMKANIVHPTSKSTDENQDEVAMTEVTDISPKTYLENVEESNKDSDKAPVETNDLELLGSARG